MSNSPHPLEFPCALPSKTSSAGGLYLTAYPELSLSTDTVHAVGSVQLSGMGHGLQKGLRTRTRKQNNVDIKMKSSDISISRITTRTVQDPTDIN